MISRSEQRFIRVNFITIIVTLLVILAGGIVRSTGSGMGCPDWPKCFDQYIPPTDVSQLPADYKEKYVAGRLKKNEKFAAYLESIGKKSLADDIRNDKSIILPEEFNPAKTWTEYINRLVGAVTGIFLLLTAVYSFAYKKKAKRIVILSVLNIFVVAYQAWLGSIVVSTNLTQWVITIHMLLAIVILAISIYTYNYARQLQRGPFLIMYKVMWLKGFVIFSVILSVFQIILGTEVREAIDVVSKNLLDTSRYNWILKVQDVLEYHRDIAILVLISSIVIYKMVIDRFSGKEQPLVAVKITMVVLAVQMVSGLILSYLGLPPYAQAIHVLFSTILFSLQFYLFLLVMNTKTYNQSIN